MFSSTSLENNVENICSKGGLILSWYFRLGIGMSTIMIPILIPALNVILEVAGIHCIVFYCTLLTGPKGHEN